MTSFKRDNNGVTPINGVLNTDGITPKAVVADPVFHGIAIMDGTTGAPPAAPNAKRDDNSVPCLMATSTDGITPVALAVDASGNLLIQST